MTGTGLANCGALDSLAASGDGVKEPVKQKPLVWAARMPACLPNTLFSASTKSCGVTCATASANGAATSANTNPKPNAFDLLAILLPLVTLQR